MRASDGWRANEVCLHTSDFRVLLVGDENGTDVHLEVGLALSQLVV